jgi:hypothetical protein
MHSMRTLSRSGIVLVTLALGVAGSPRAQAQVALPSIASTLPQAAAPGQTVDVKIRGAGLAGPTQLWTSFPVEAVLPTEIAGNGTNAAEITYRLKVAADVSPGVHGIRVVTGTGISNLKLFAIDDLPSVAQVKPSNTVATAQALTLPVAVDGYVDNLSRDFYKFQAAAGQQVSIEVLARRLGSPLDSTVRLLDARGREVAYNDDAPGLGSDSMISHTFKEAGEYVLEVRDIRYQGGGNFLYRLRIGDFPCVTVPYPMAVQRGVSSSVAFAGSTAQGAQPIPVNVAAPTVDWLPLGARLASGKSSGFAVVAVGASPEALEAEPNNEQAQATRVALGAGLNGRFDQPRDVDRFIFTAKAGQRFTFAGVTRSQGSPSDLAMRLLKSDGAEVAVVDDSGTNEGVIDYTFPADGDYTLVVEDLNRRGGPEFAYRIAVTPHEEKFQLAASADTLNIPLGGLATVTVTAVRGSFAGPIALTLVDAPPGIVATPAVIGPGLPSTVMTIQCAADVAAGKIYPVRIAGTAQSGTVQYQAIATVTDAQKGAFSGLTVPPPFLSQSVAIGVNPAPLFILKTDKPEVVFGKDLSASVKLLSTKVAGFDEEIAVAVLPPAPAGLPPGVTAAVKPIAKGTNEVEIVFAANAQAPLGEFSAVLTGTGKLGNNTSVQPIPALSLSLRPPFALKPDFAGGNLAKGQTLKVKIVAERNPAYAGPITLTFQNLPKGVTAAAALIAAGQNEAEVVLTAAADAAAGAVPNVIVQGEGMNGNAKVTGASAATALTIP